MNYKLLVLCDEVPNEYKGYEIKDFTYFNRTIITPNEDSDIVFMSWDAIIPEDRTFIEKCIYYSKTFDITDPTFLMTKRGKTNAKYGTLKDSMQETSYYNVLKNNIKYLQNEINKGNDSLGIALDLSVQYPFMATQKFMEDFSSALINNNIVRILPCYSNSTNENLTRHRREMLDSWVNSNRIMPRSSIAKVLSPVYYDSIEEVQKQAKEEMLEVYSLTISIDEDKAINHLT